MVSKRKDSVNGNRVWRGFLDVRLPEGLAWEEIAKACPPEGALEWLGTLVNAGYKVSVNYSADNDAYICSLTGTQRSGGNAGYTMTTWSNRLERAVCASWYKAFVVCDGGSWGDPEQKSLVEI